MNMITDKMYNLFNYLKSKEVKEFTHTWKFITGDMRKYNSIRFRCKRNLSYRSKDCKKVYSGYAKGISYSL